MEGSVANTVTLTKYKILTSDDEGTTWKIVGDQLARSSDAALRTFFAEPPADGGGLYAAVSENAFKPRKVEARVKTTLTEFVA